MYAEKYCGDDNSSTSFRSCGHHILLVDDNQSVVDVGRQMLERLGFKVTPITESLKALEVFQSNPSDFDLVITDLSMPELGGDQLVEKIVNIRGDIPIILCSGFNDAMGDDLKIYQDIKDVLQKPVSMSQFSESIAKALEASRDNRKNDYYQR